MALSELLRRHLFFAPDQGVENVFKLVPGRHNDVSIRYRTWLVGRLVKEAHAHGLIQRRAAKLLIVNGGAAGLSAALVASRLGVPSRITTSAELGAPLFGCKTRWVDPGIYHWPKKAWTKTDVEVGEQNPLAWEAGWAHDIAEGWRRQLEDARKSEDLIEVSIHQQPTARVNYPDYGALRRDLDPEGEYSVYLITGGLSDNCDAAPNYRGFRYWETDTLEDWGLLGGKAPTVLICGAGDGALQDFLRLTCKKPAREIFDRLFNSSLNQHGAGEFLRRAARLVEVSKDILMGEVEPGGIDDPQHFAATEVRAVLRRAFLQQSSEVLPEGYGLAREQEFHLGHEPKLEGQELREALLVVHQLFQNLIGQLVTRTVLWNEVCEAAYQQIVFPFAADGAARLGLAFRARGFSLSYPLNQFLVLLIEECVRQRYPELRLFYPGNQLEGVFPTPTTNADLSAHRCMGNPEVCFGEEHRAEFAHNGATPVPLDPSITHNVVVIRF